MKLSPPEASQDPGALLRTAPPASHHALVTGLELGGRSAVKCRCQGANDGRSCGRVRVGGLCSGAWRICRHSEELVRQRAADLYSGLTQLAIRVSWHSAMQHHWLLLT